MPGPSSRAGLRNWIGWGFAIAVIASCLLLLDVDEMLAAVQRVEAGAVALILVLLTCDRVLMALKWRLLLGVGGAHLSRLAVIGIYYQGWLVGAFLPTHIGGDALRGHLVAERTGIVQPVLASLVMEKMIGLLSAANWAIVGGVVVTFYLLPNEWPIWVGLGVLSAVVFNALFLLSLHQAVHGLMLRLLARYWQVKLLRLLHGFYDAYAALSRHPNVLLANFLLTLLEHGLQLLIVFAIAVSLGVDVQTIIFFAAAAVQTLFLRIPIAPDGWGTGELAAIGVFGLIGISAATAFTLSVVHRFLGVAAVLPGVLLFILLPRDISGRDVAARWGRSLRLRPARPVRLPRAMVSRPAPRPPAPAGAANLDGPAKALHRRSA